MWIKQLEKSVKLLWDNFFQRNNQISLSGLHVEGTTTVVRNKRNTNDKDSYLSIFIIFFSLYLNTLVCVAPAHQNTVHQPKAGQNLSALGFIQFHNGQEAIGHTRTFNSSGEPQTYDEPGDIVEETTFHSRGFFFVIALTEWTLKLIIAVKNKGQIARMICAKSGLEQAFCWCFCFYPHMSTDPRPAGCCPASSGSASQPASRSWSSRRAVWVKWAVLFFFFFCTAGANGLEVSALGLRLGLWGGGLNGGGGGGLVFEWAVFGGREAELFWHLLIGRGLLVEAQFAQQLIDLRPGHVWQGDPLRANGSNKTWDKRLSFSPRQVFVGRKIWFIMLIVWNEPAPVIWIIVHIVKPVFLLLLQP